MRTLSDLQQAENELQQALDGVLGRIRALVSGQPRTLEQGIELLRDLRATAYEDLNQIQHAALILDAARWLRDHGKADSRAEWHWNPYQTGTAEEPDLRVTVDGKVVISVEATASRGPAGVIDSRMRDTLAKLGELPGQKYYFVKTEAMARRAKTKISRGRHDIEVIVP